MLLESLLAAFIVSTISLIGVFSLFLKQNSTKKIVHFLVALSAGTLLGGAFLHILPEALESSQNSDEVFLIFIFGFSLFFVLERILRWRHCHEINECKVHPVGIINLFGDGIHNFLDGILITVSFVADFHLGVVTTFAVILHEIPQELGDFGVFIHAGFSPLKALFFNFISAATSILGVFVGFFLGEQISGFEYFLLAFAGGGFLHIAASDLVPELHKEKDAKKAIISFLIFMMGIFLMWGIRFVK